MGPKSAFKYGARRWNFRHLKSCPSAAVSADVVQTFPNVGIASVETTDKY
jgi:hypothetical protein